MALQLSNVQLAKFSKLQHSSYGEGPYSSPLLSNKYKCTANFQSSTGAGDAFIAGILFPLIYNEPDNNGISLIRRSADMCLPDMLQFANEIAGRKVIQEGFDGLGQAMLKSV